MITALRRSDPLAKLSAGFTFVQEVVIVSTFPCRSWHPKTEVAIELGGGRKIIYFENGNVGSV